MTHKHTQNLNLQEYANVSAPIPVARFQAGLTQTALYPPRAQKILRMCVKLPRGELRLPQELNWLSPALIAAIRYQEATVPDGCYSRYIYITVRVGEVNTRTDDVWHVDGFSMRVPHVPEQNYIWADRGPTQWLEQKFPLPDDFDPMRHNLHMYFNTYGHPANIRTLDPCTMYQIDPYCVHRRDPETTGMKQRAFLRISFIPIEIEDDTCTPNPRLPLGPYNRGDIRKTLVPYDPTNGL